MIPPTNIDKAEASKVLARLGQVVIETRAEKGDRIEFERKSKDTPEGLIPVQRSEVTIKTPIEGLGAAQVSDQYPHRNVAKGTDLSAKSSLRLLGVSKGHLPQFKENPFVLNILENAKGFLSKVSAKQKRSHDKNSEGKKLESKGGDPTKRLSHASQESDKSNENGTAVGSGKRQIKYKIGSIHSRSSFQMKNDSFRGDIVRIAKKNRVKVNAKLHAKRSEREENFNIYKRVNLLRYRDDIYKAASKLSMNISPFPIWVYKDQPRNKLNIVTINVGGKKFEVFDDTIMNIPHTKLSNCYVNHSGDPTLFFDRDAGCFNHVINFFRSGRLHAPSKDCLSFFEEELQFWGVNEDLMEPCCYSEYMAYKNTCDTLKRYADAKIPTGTDFTDDLSKCQTLRQKVYMICTSHDCGVLGKWYAIVCGVAIILSVTTMIIAADAQGRIDKKTETYSERRPDESLVNFFSRTTVNPSVNFLDLVLVLFFVVDFLSRCVLCPDRLLFFSDSINWIDLIATLSSLLSYLSRKKVQSGEYEAYILFMKSPRVFRMFRLTKNLKLGFDALVLTLRARSSALKMVFTLAIITMSIFGTLIYVVELVNEKKGRNSQFKSIIDGMWFAIVTMSTVGYGDLTPQSASGYIVGFFCIITGIIISQLPVPIILKNFANYYEQMHSRQREMNKVLNKNIDPENFMQERLSRKKMDEHLMKENDGAPA